MIHLVQVGHTKKPFGTSGLIKVRIKDPYTEILEKLEFVFLDLNGSKVPFFIEEKESHPLALKLEGIDSPQEGADISNLGIWVEREIADEYESDSARENYEQFVGYKVISGGKEIGIIESIEQFPEQIMAFVNINNNSSMIPLVEGLISKINPETKEIIMELPEGLTEIK